MSNKNETKPPLHLEKGNYQVTVVDVSDKESVRLGVFGVAVLTVEASDNDNHPHGSSAQFVWRKRGFGFDYSELEEYVGEKLYVRVQEMKTRRGRTFLNYTFTTTALDATVGP